MTQDFNRQNNDYLVSQEEKENKIQFGYTPSDIIDDGTVGTTPPATRTYRLLSFEEESVITYTNELGGYNASSETVAAGVQRWGIFHNVSVSSGKVLGYRT